MNRLKNHLEELKDLVVGKMLLENQIIQWYIIFTLDFKKFDDPYILREPHVTITIESSDLAMLPSLMLRYPLVKVVDPPIFK